MTMKPYTCNEYRQEMILAGLRKRLADPNLSDSERKDLEEQVHQLEREMDLD